MKKFYAFLIIVMVAACTHQKPAPTETAEGGKPLTWEQVLKEQGTRADSLTTVLGKMSVEFEGHDESVRGLGTSGVILPNDYLLEIRDPVGRLHFQAVNRGSSFEGYFPRYKKIYKDRSSGKPFFQKTWGMPISFPELSRLSAGLLPKMLEKQKPASLQWGEGAYEAKFAVEKTDASIGLNEEGALTRLHWQRPEGDVDVTWRDFRPCCKWKTESSFSFAHAIEIKTKDSVILIRWKSLQNWETIPPEAFKVQTTAGTKVIQLD